MVDGEVLWETASGANSGPTLTGLSLLSGIGFTMGLLTLLSFFASAESAVSGGRFPRLT